MADYHEEQGDDLASECWRWLADKERYTHWEKDGWKNGDRMLHHWWNNLSYQERFFDWPESSFLPTVLLENVPCESNRPHNYGECMGFSSRQNSFRAAVVGWKKLTQEKRDECWRWEP